MYNIDVCDQKRCPKDLVLLQTYIYIVLLHSIMKLKIANSSWTQKKPILLAKTPPHPNPPAKPLLMPSKLQRAVEYCPWWHLNSKIYSWNPPYQPQTCPQCRHAAHQSPCGQLRWWRVSHGTAAAHWVDRGSPQTPLFSGAGTSPAASCCESFEPKMQTSKSASAS